jgi:hypothetical protein
MGEADLIKNWVPNQSGFLSTKLHDDSASSSQSGINMMNCKTSISNNMFFFTIRNQHDDLQTSINNSSCLFTIRNEHGYLQNIIQQQQLQLLFNQQCV